MRTFAPNRAAASVRLSSSATVISLRVFARFGNNLLTERDWPGDRLRSYKVIGVVTRLFVDKSQAAAYAGYRGIRWRPARAMGFVGPAR